MQVRVLKQANPTSKKKILCTVMALVLAMVLTSLLIAVMGHNPFQVYYSMIEGCIGTPHRVRQTIITAIPLVITSIGVGIAFRMRFWNIGAEGQILMGGCFATFAALYFKELPGIVLLPTMMLLGALGGGLWALIPALLKAKFNTNETIVTLMMNYIALKWIVFLQYGPWKDPAAMGFPKIANFTDNAILPKVFGVHIGWIIALSLVGAIYYLIYYTKTGYEIQVLGESENTARYAGMNVKKVILIAMMLSGAICGLTGMIQASAVNNTLTMDLTAGVGNTAIIIAWLSNLKTPWMLVVSILFAILNQGASYIQTVYQIPQAAAEVIQGIILFCILGSQFFIHYKVRFEKDKYPVSGQGIAQSGLKNKEEVA
ncbi:MAG: ABC transporter permease [Niameybacter sp.]|uniref:ABC transporter permease n=1 Tax=Niameybacter sp. TaxID=2033640 RepID=UPI002FC9BD50